MINMMKICKCTELIVGMKIYKAEEMSLWRGKCSMVITSQHNVSINTCNRNSIL